MRYPGLFPGGQEQNSALGPSRPGAQLGVGTCYPARGAAVQGPQRVRFAEKCTPHPYPFAYITLHPSPSFTYITLRFRTRSCSIKGQLVITISNLYAAFRDAASSRMQTGGGGEGSLPAADGEDDAYAAAAKATAAAEKAAAGDSALYCILYAYT